MEQNFIVKLKLKKNVGRSFKRDQVVTGHMIIRTSVDVVIMNKKSDTYKIPEGWYSVIGNPKEIPEIKVRRPTKRKK